MFKLSERGAIQFIVLLILLLGIVGAVLLVTRGEPLKLLPRATVSGPIGPQTSLTLSPSRPNYNVGEEVVVQILVRADVDAANLFKAKINFDPSILQLGRVDVTSLFIKNWVEQYWGDPGKISLIGGVPSPGYQTQQGSAAGLMATLYFTALTAGSTTVSFDDASEIYSNSTNTNILGIKNNATLTISAVGVPSPTPAPTITPSPTPAATPLPQSSSYRRVFITSTGYNGNLGGATAGDTKCQERANAVGLGGTWKAWLSDDTSSASSRLEHASVPYRRLDGVTLANSWNDLTDGTIQDSVAITELGTVHAGWVWTNTNASGNKNGAESCNNWTSSDVANSGWFGQGNIIPPSTRWTAEARLSCNNAARLYCFEQAAVPVATPVPGTGDGNNDGKVNLVDLSILLSDFNKEKGFRTGIDLNGDGKINTFDFSLMRNLLIQKGVIRG